MKIAILGGTFNPVHNGHIQMTEGFARQIGADRVLLIPTHTPPHKSGDQLADPVHRLNMCRLAAADRSGWDVSSREIRRGGVSYTIETLRELKREDPSAQLFLICGGDMLATLDSWYQADEIVKTAVICAAARGQSSDEIRAAAEKTEKMGGRVLLAGFPVDAVSSTQVRERIRAGEDVSALVPPAVADYIAKNGLYKG